MKTSLFDYSLPKGFVANFPASPRDHSKLMIIDRKSGNIHHRKFFEIGDFLSKNDVLVFNETKVFPARLFGQKDSGGKIEILLSKQIGPARWEGLIKGKVSQGQKIYFGKAEASVWPKSGGLTIIEFKLDGKNMWKFLSQLGHTPIPPYISSSETEQTLRSIYQTVYAKNMGSIAAPTAGFHFTHKLLQNLKSRGVQTEFVTLHVGLGTFLPIKENSLEKHKMHEESFNVDKNTYKRLMTAKKEGKRIIAVGTTSARVLESLSSQKLSGTTDIFIFPPYKFKVINSLITNFHLPHSTLLALVSALVSKPNTPNEFKSFRTSLMGRAYKEAIQNNYRFYSFGDSSLIL